MVIAGSIRRGSIGMRCAYIQVFAIVVRQRYPLSRAKHMNSELVCVGLFCEMSVCAFRIE